MKSKKQQNRNATVKATKGEAVKEETVAVATKTTDRKRQSTDVPQAVPTKIKKQEEAVLTPSAKSRKRKNRKKKIDAAANAATKTPQTPKKGEEGKEEASIAYLKLWQEDRKSWKFQKIRQIWLNDNMLNNVTLTDDVFPTWLEYMAGSSERQKQYVVKKAMEALKELEAANSTVDDADDARYQRAKKIIQSLDVEEEDDDDDDDDDDSSS